MKINFRTFAESTIQRLNLTMTSGEHHELFFSPLRCHDHKLDCKDRLEALIEKSSHCLCQLRITVSPFCESVAPLL